MSRQDATHKDGRRPTFSDRVSLWLAVLAKSGRRKLRSPSESDSSQFYERFFSAKDYEDGLVDGRRKIRRETLDPYIKENVAVGGNILDVGCGFGEVLHGLPDGYALFGVDYSNTNVEAARKLLEGKALIQQGSINELPFETNSMDCCLCLEVLEHIEDDTHAVCEIGRQLKSGGILIVAVPYTYYWAQYQELIGHFRHYTRESLTDLIQNNGLQVIEFLPNHPNWHLAYVRRYCWARFLSSTLGRLAGCRNVFEFKWPWAKETLMEKTARKLRPVLESDRQITYSTAESSTFIAARKL